MWNKQIGPGFPTAFSRMIARMLAPDRCRLCFGYHIRIMQLARALGFAAEFVHLGFHDKIRFIRVIRAVMNLKIALCRLERTPDTVWQLLGQLSDFIGIKNRHCELWCNMPPCSLQED